MNILLIIISVLLNAVAQIFIRKGMLEVGQIGTGNAVHAIGPMLHNLWLWAAMASYAISVYLWMVVLSKVEVSFAYPFLSIGYVVAAVVGFYCFNENLNPIRITGIIVICLGVFLISRS